MSKTIVQVLYGGDDLPIWDYLDSLIEQHEQIVNRDESQATLEDLAWLCDRKAEAVNAHNFCGVHRLLGAVLYQQYGREEATKTMLRIAKLGGLHGMNGVCCDTDAYALLGVGENGRDWNGSYGNGESPPSRCAEYQPGDAHFDEEYS